MDASYISCYLQHCNDIRGIRSTPLYYILQFIQLHSSNKYVLGTNFSIWSYPCIRPWGPIQLATQLAHRWRRDCRLYAPAALYAQKDFLYSFVARWVESGAIARLEELGHFYGIEPAILQFIVIITVYCVYKVRLPKLDISIQNYVELKYKYVGFDVFKTVVIKSSWFQNIGSCRTLQAIRCFKGTCRLHHQGLRISQARN
jgi:hypothetical protein